MSKSDKSSIHFTNHLEKTSISVDQALQNEALATLKYASLPTTRDEAWKYTRVAKINKIEFKNEQSSLEDIQKFIIDSNAITLVFVNGHYSDKLSNRETVDGLTIESLSNKSNAVTSSLPQNDEIFNSINTLFLNDGVEINIEKNSTIEKTIQILHILDGVDMMSNFKTIIKAGDFSKASVIQGFFATENCSNSFANVTTEVKVGINAFLTIDKLQYENESSYHINSEFVDQGKDSTFTINTVTLNGMLVRNNLNIEVNGENCTSNLNGAYLLKNRQHVDNHTIVDHKVPNCNSNEMYKGVIDDNSTAVFNGKVFVRKDAQKINAFQSNGNVLLTDDASINSKPELEIYADDVKCSHGSTTGQLDEDAVFYLRARGLSEKSARKLLVSAFVQEVFDQIENETFMAYVERCLAERFSWIS